jgi:co-chaperonin GroES (HSP10)
MKNQTNKPLPFIPTGNNILLEEIKDAEKIGSIWLPDTVRKPVNQGWIVALGEDVEVRGSLRTSLSTGEQSENPNGLKVGDIVVFPLHTEHRMEVDRRKFIIINQNDVLLTDRGHFSELASLQKEKEKENGQETT